MKRKIREKIIPESIDQHIDEEYRKSKDFRKVYDEEISRLKLAYKIAQLRRLRHLTQKGLAERVGTTQQNISRLEDFGNTQVNLHTLVRLAGALKASLSIDFVPQV